VAERIYEDRAAGLTLEVEQGYPAELVDLARRTVWGTEGLLYRVHEIEQEIDSGPDPLSLLLHRQGKLVGILLLMRKSVEIGDTRLPVLYGTAIAVAPEYVAQGYGRLIAEQTKRRFLDEAPGPLMFYGYIESENARSLGLARAMGYESVGTFAALVVSRISPSDDPAVEPLDDEEGMLQRLVETYGQHALLDFDLSYRPADFWVLRRANEIVAGVQVKVKCWTVIRAGGLPSFLLRAMPWLPLTRRLLKRGQVFPFLSLGHLYSREGHENDLFCLVEALMKRRGVHAAVAYGDVACPVMSRLRGGRVGLLGRLGVDARAEVMAGFSHVPDDLQQEIRRRPLLISPIDPG
jgi:GNAT superfamily N-acetyltransferase